MWLNDLDNGLKNVTGNVSFIEKTEKFNTINLFKKENLSIRLVFK